MRAFLTKVDPDENINRWYLVFVQATLLDPMAVTCMWGSRETTWQQIRVIPAPNLCEAERLAEKIVRQKLKRGYELQPE
jgi:predicted DNA-binding WGR domain protein